MKQRSYLDSVNRTYYALHWPLRRAARAIARGR